MDGPMIEGKKTFVYNCDVSLRVTLEAESFEDARESARRIMKHIMDKKSLGLTKVGLRTQPHFSEVRVPLVAMSFEDNEEEEVKEGDSIQGSSS